MSVHYTHTLALVGVAHTVGRAANVVEMTCRPDGNTQQHSVRLDVDRWTSLATTRHNKHQPTYHAHTHTHTHLNGLMNIADAASCCRPRIRLPIVRPANAPFDKWLFVWRRSIDGSSIPTRSHRAQRNISKTKTETTHLYLHIRGHMGASQSGERVRMIMTR